MPTKRDLIGEEKGKRTTVTIKEFSPQGVRTEGNYEGVLHGKYNARTNGTNLVLRRPDGGFEGEFREIQRTKDGDVILVTGKHTGRIVGSGSNVAAEAEVTFQISSKKLAWLNSTKGLAEVKLSLDAGTYTGKFYAVK